MKFEPPVEDEEFVAHLDEWLSKVVRRRNAGDKTAARVVERVQHKLIRVARIMADAGDASDVHSYLSPIEGAIGGGQLTGPTSLPMVDQWREAAQHRIQWPILLSARLNRGKENENHELDRLMSILKELNLGGKSGLNWDGKTPSPKSPEVRAAFQLHMNLSYFKWNAIRHREEGTEPTDWWEEAARTLPDLNRASFSKWWDLARRVFAEVFGEDFENHRYFEHYWRNKRYEEDIQDGEANWVRRVADRAGIRKDIKARVRQAYRSLAAKK